MVLPYHLEVLSKLQFALLDQYSISILSVWTFPPALIYSIVTSFNIVAVLFQVWQCRTPSQQSPVVFPRIVAILSALFLLRKHRADDLVKFSKMKEPLCHVPHHPILLVLLFVLPSYSSRLLKQGYQNIYVLNSMPYPLTTWFQSVK